MKKIILLCGLLASQMANAQKVFTESELISVVKKFHPIAKQASMAIEIADAKITASRGGFDPVASVDNGRKTFDGVNYYDNNSTELKVPTWYGIDFYSGIENLEGDRLNPEKTKGRIEYFGVSIPLLQNLLYDKRRAALQQAKAIRQQSEQEQRTTINNLIVEALQSYWTWWGHYQVLSLVEASFQNAIKRNEMVKTSYLLGERAAIDTLEAATQVQSIQQMKIKAQLDVEKARLELSGFLWTDKNNGFDLPLDIQPGNLGTQADLMLDSFLLVSELHPALLEYEYKLQVLEIEKRLKFQALLPQVNAKYNIIGRNFNSALKSNFFQNNYRYGFSIAIPLRLSEGRGEYKAARLKIAQIQLDRQLKQVLIRNKIRQHYIEWQQTIAMQELQERLIRNYLALYTAEETKFLNGESTLFVMNAREVKVIEEQKKNIEITAKVRELAARVKWAAGIL